MVFIVYITLMLHGEITGLPVVVTNVSCFELFKHHDMAAFSTVQYFFCLIVSKPKVMVK